MRERFVDVGSIRLRLCDWGSNTDPPVLFWHALGDHTSLQAAELAGLLAERHGRRVLAVDAPGFGRSQALARADDYLTPSLAGVVIGLLDTLGIERAALIGASWGGTIAVYTAAAHPGRVRAAVLLDGGYRDPPAAEQSLEELLAHWRGQPGFRYPTWDALFEDARTYFGHWSPALETAVGDAYEERDGEVCSRMGPDLYATVIWALTSSPPSHEFAALAEGRVPVLALVATEPPDENRDAAVAAFRVMVPQATVQLLPGRHHWLLEEASEQIAGLVGDWLRTL
jgi:pimeloyl-ACP methyl ester carboxylesterase